MAQGNPAHPSMSLLYLTPFSGSQHPQEKNPDSLAGLSRPSHTVPSVPPHLLPSCHSSASDLMLPTRPLHMLCPLPGTPSPLLSQSPRLSSSHPSRLSSSLLFLGEAFAEPSPFLNATDHSPFGPHSTRYPGTLHCPCLSVCLSVS